MICSSSNRRAIFIGPSPARHSSKIYRTTFAAGSSIIHCFGLSVDFIYPKGTAEDTRSPFSAFDFQTAFIFLLVCSAYHLLKILYKWHHLNSRACKSVYIFLNGNKGYSKRRINNLRQSAHFNRFSAETGQVFHDNCTDFAVFRHLLHTLKSGAVKGCP